MALVVASAANDFGDVVFVAVVMGGAWAAGRTQHRRLLREAVMISERELLIERQHDAAARGAAQERARIARELHDIVAHRVSMIVVQAQAADAMWSVRPHDARQVVRSIDEGARAALGELRSMLGIMRNHSTDAELQPQPGLDSIGELTEGARRAGVRVDLVCEGELAGVPTVVGMAAYRIVQEALTNVTKHADGAHTTVLIRRSPDELHVHVLDDGRADVPAHAMTVGYGLAGMRERVALLNGSFRSGPAERGGFEVSASLPLPGGTQP
jgi:signal transduction histidine kinase